MKTITRQPLAHRNPSGSLPSYSLNNKGYTILDRLTYGVPTERRLLTPGIFNKRFDRIRDYLGGVGLTAAERQVALNLLRLYCYYGKVYPKASCFTEERGCSRRTFWRAVAKLEQLGLLDRINRYIHHLQISNAYRLDLLILILARLLAEHGHHFTDKFALALLEATDRSFWRTIWTARIRLRDSMPIRFAA